MVKKVKKFGSVMLTDEQVRDLCRSPSLIPKRLLKEVTRRFKEMELRDREKNRLFRLRQWQSWKLGYVPLELTGDEPHERDRSRS